MTELLTRLDLATAKALTKASVSARSTRLTSNTSAKKQMSTRFTSEHHRTNGGGENADQDYVDTLGLGVDLHIYEKHGAGSEHAASGAFHTEIQRHCPDPNVK